jgi:hypothetical protein
MQKGVQSPVTFYLGSGRGVGACVQGSTCFWLLLEATDDDQGNGPTTKELVQLHHVNHKTYFYCYNVELYIGDIASCSFNPIVGKTNSTYVFLS